MLSDPQKRAIYDHHGHGGIHGGHGGGGGGGGGMAVDPNELFAQMFGSMQEMMAQMMAQSGGQMDLSQGVQFVFSGGVPGQAGAVPMAFNVRFQTQAGGGVAPAVGGGGGGAAPRSFEEQAKLVDELRAECFRNDPLTDADRLTPPEHARLQWSRGELRRFFETGGAFRPLCDAAPSAADRARLGARLPTRPAPLTPLAGGSVLEMLEQPHAADVWSSVAEAVERDGYAVLRMGADAADVWQEAASEVRRAEQFMRPPTACAKARGDVEVDLGALVRLTQAGRNAWPMLCTLNEKVCATHSDQRPNPGPRQQ